MAKRAEAEGELSVTDILSAIRKRVTDETGARYARDSEIVRREMLVLRPEARIDAALADAAPEPAPEVSKAAPAKPMPDADLEARIIAILMAELKNPDGRLRAALRDALNAELGGD